MQPWIRIAFAWPALLLGVGAGAGSPYSMAPDGALPAALEDAATRPGRIVLGGRTIPYTATAGHLTATGADGAPEAAFFYVAYTADGQDPATRPVTFLYNGGPGSPSVWLHLGSFGPRRLVTGDPATSAPTPFPLVENRQCLLDRTDLVFVDAVGTGLSEAVAPNTNQTFWGVDQDAGAFRDFIRRYLAANQREASPKYLFGESYGTPRSAVLANLLEAAGVDLTGVVLQSAILNYNSNGAAGSGISCAGFLPTYGAVGAWYRLDQPQPADLPAFIQQMRAFTVGSYAPAVTAWLNDQTPPDPALAAQLQADTGIGAATWQQDLNLLPGDYQNDLIPGTLIGRYDARVSAPVGSPLAADGDPSSTFISASFASTITGYLTRDLGYADGQYYAMVGNASEYWDFSHDGLALPDTIPDLAAALARNPRLKVLSLNGYDDLATPFYQTELDLARLDPQPSLGIKHYLGGHMVYLDNGSQALEKADLAAFYQGAAGWAGNTEALLASRRGGPAPAPAQPEAAALPRRGGLLFDPYVPAGKWHPAPETATTGAALRAQVARKLLGGPARW